MEVYKCIIMNYDDKPLLSVSLDLRVALAVVEPRQDGALESGAIIADRSWPLKIGKIDTGRDNPFVFYVVNRTNNFLFVWLNNKGRAERLGEQNSRSVKIAGDVGVRMSFGPPRALPTKPETSQPHN
jgi:hypothetical protein